MPKQEASKGTKEVFEWYLLQFKRFRGVTKFNEKWKSKCHDKSMKIDTLGTIGGDCWDLGWFLGDLEFNVVLWFCDQPKINKNLQIIQKWGESDAKGGASAQISNESRSREGSPDLEGGTALKTPLSDTCGKYKCAVLLVLRLWSLAGLLFYQCFLCRRFRFFLRGRKRKKLGINIQKWSKM